MLILPAAASFQKKADLSGGFRRGFHTGGYRFARPCRIPFFIEPHDDFPGVWLLKEVASVDNKFAICGTCLQQTEQILGLGGNHDIDSVGGFAVPASPGFMRLQSVKFHGGNRQQKPRQQKVKESSFHIKSFLC